MLHKKHLTNASKIEKQITDEVINDLFKIFINSKDEKEFVKEVKSCNYKNANKLWSIFFPKYDKYRQDNLKNNASKVLHS